MQKWIFSPASSLLTLLSQYTPTLHELDPEGNRWGKGENRRRAAETSRGWLELLMAVDLHAQPWFCGLHMIDYFTAAAVKKCLITHQAQMGAGTPQSRIDWVTRFQSDTTEVFLITNHIIFTVAWWFGTSQGYPEFCSSCFQEPADQAVIVWQDRSRPLHSDINTLIVLFPPFLFLAV